ncbi:MAG: glycosyltransferase [Clostridiales bacterium]|nr:glycosyltransferase [Clostridiales bacterium]
MREKISVVVPIYNSEKTIRKLLNRLHLVLYNFNDYEIILIDDCSHDQSYKVIKESNITNTTYIRLSKNVGQQLATFYGLMQTSGDYVIIIDDDLEQNPEDIVKLYSEIKKGFHVVYGIDTKVKQKKLIRSIGSSLRDWLFNRLTNKQKNILVSSFRIMDRQLVNKVLLADCKFIYLSMEILKNTNLVGNVAITYEKNKESNYHLLSLIKIWWMIYLYYGKCNMLKIFRKKLQPFIIEERSIS